MGSPSALDRWRQDVFFPAAEAVQDSADIMQSAYRAWMRERARQSQSSSLKELSRELQMALGTAKWQLEEFERATKAAHGTCSSEDDDRITRHRHFVEATKYQILQVEKDLRGAFVEGCKQPLCWVQLDDGECNELATFLCPNPIEQRDPDGRNQIQAVGGPVGGKGFGQNSTVEDDPKYIIDVEIREEVNNNFELPETQRRTWSSPDIGDWKIVISEEDDSKMKSLKNKIRQSLSFINLYGFVKSTRMSVKSKRPSNNLQCHKNGILFSTKNFFSSYCNVRTISRFSQGRDISTSTHHKSSSSEEGSKKPQIPKTSGTIMTLEHPLQGLPSFMQFRSLKIILFLILAVFFIVPFVFCAN